MTSEISFHECACDGEKIFLVHYTTGEPTKLLCKNCFTDPVYKSQIKFAYNIKTQAKIEIQSITKFVRKNSTDYFCDNCNASYPTLKLLRADHPELVESEFIVIDKTEGN